MYFSLPLLQENACEEGFAAVGLAARIALDGHGSRVFRRRQKAPDGLRAARPPEFQVDVACMRKPLPLSAFEAKGSPCRTALVIRHAATAEEEIACIRWHMGAFEKDTNLWNYYGKAIEKYPNVTIEKEIFAGENYHNKVKEYTEENLVHVAMMGSDVRHGKNWAEKQVNIKADLEPGYYHIGSFPRGDNGEIYYVPDGAKNLCSVVVINMELLNEIGGKVPENYDDLVALAVLCESEGIDCLTAFGGTGWRWGTDIFSPIVARTTGDANWVQKVAKGKAKFTDAGFVAALEAVKKYFDDGIFDQSILAFDSDNLPDPDAKFEKLTSGATLMFTCEQSDLSKYSLGEDLSNYKLLPFMPVYGEKNNMRFCVAAADNIGWGITVATNSDPAVREAAINLVKFATNVENATKKVEAGAVTGPVVQSLYQKPIEEFGTLATQKMFILEKYKNVDVIDAYLPQEINGVLFTAVKDMVQKGKTATEAAQDVQTAYEAML